MATAQEMIKARELAKTWVPLADAVRQVRTPQTGVTNAPVNPIQNAPVAWVAPQVTQPVAPTVMPEAKAGDAVIWVNGERFIQANNYDWSTNTTGTPSVVNQSGWDVSKLQQVQALANAKRFSNEQASLVAPTPIQETPTSVNWDKTAEIKAKTDAKLIENQQNAQLKEQERQNIAKETAQANIPTNQQDVLNALVSWQSVTPQKTQAYRNAQFQYNKFTKFNAMTPTQMLNSIKQGEIWSDMDRLLSQNPNYIQAKQELDNIQNIERLNSNTKTYVNWINWDSTQPVDALQSLSDKIIASLGISDETYANAFSQYVTDNPKIVDYTTQLSNVNKQIADQTNLINEWIKQVKKDKWDMPASTLLTYMASQFSEANDYLTTLNNTKTYLEADLKNATEMAKSNYDAVSKDIDNALNQKNTVISNLIQQQFSLAWKQAESELAKKIAQEAMNDPYTAIPQMIEEYKKLGIPFTRSTQQIIQDFESSGKDLATYLSDLQWTIQSKPEFKRYQEIQQGQMSDAEKLGASQEFDLKKMW
jgi:hypothetical protein